MKYFILFYVYNLTAQKAMGAGEIIWSSLVYPNREKVIKAIENDLQQPALITFTNIIEVTQSELSVWENK